MIEFLLKIIILVWPFGQLMRTLLGGTTIYALDILCSLLTVTLFLSAKSRQNIKKGHLTRPLLIFLFFASVSLIIQTSRLSSSDALRASFYLLRLFVYPAIYFAVKIVEFKKIKSSLIASLIIFISFGLAQYIFFPDATSLKFIGFDDHYYRLIGTLFDPNYTGLVFVVILLYFLVNKKYLSSVALIPLIALTFSRASFLVLVITTMIISIQKRWKAALIVPIVLVLAILVSPKPFGEGVNLLRSFSIFSRLTSWQEGINLFISSPVLGVGYNTLTTSSGQRIGIDNSFIYILSTTGIFGFASFVYLLFFVFKTIRNTDFFIPILAILLHSLFNNSLFFIWIFSLFWIMVGLAARDYRQS